MAESSYTNAEFLGLAGKADARFRGKPVTAAGQKVAFTTATANLVDLPLAAHVMLVTTAACFIRLSPTGTAAVADVDMYLIPNIPYLISLGKDADGVPNRRISAVQVAGGGNLFIMPMAAD